MDNEEIKIDPEVKDFLRKPENWKLLENKNFDKLYEKFQEYLLDDLQFNTDTYFDFVSALARPLMDLGFNPLDYLSYVPEAYLLDDSKVTLIDMSNSKIKFIMPEAFADCKNLKTIILPNSLESIKEGAFSSTSINSINIPQSVKYIDNDVFAGCDNLTKVRIPERFKPSEDAESIMQFLALFGLDTTESEAKKIYDDLCKKVNFIWT